jgi:hypothetical protein
VIALVVYFVVSPSDYGAKGHSNRKNASTSRAGLSVSCPTTSRESAIRTAKGTLGVMPTDSVTAKLMSWSELDSVADFWAPFPALTSSTQVWAVEVGPIFSILDSPSSKLRPKPAPWGIFVVDARDGSAYGPITGPGASAPYWDGLPDRSDACVP